jgi:hypothetical protein
MKNALVIVAMLALLVIAGCAPKGTPVQGDTSTDKDVSAVSSDVSDVELITADMDTADLDTLDQELNDVQTLELQ